jgi:hypothetical protein
MKNKHHIRVQHSRFTLFNSVCHQHHSNSNCFGQKASYDQRSPWFRRRHVQVRVVVRCALVSGTSGSGGARRVERGAHGRRRSRCDWRGGVHGVHLHVLRRSLARSTPTVSKWTHTRAVRDAMIVTVGKPTFAARPCRGHRAVPAKKLVRKFGAPRNARRGREHDVAGQFSFLFVFFVILTAKNANSVLNNCRNALNAVDSWFARAAPMFATNR